jgi:pyrroline-5-carboxylate reductase
MNITFIGGGNMAAALIGGLIDTGFDRNRIAVVEIAAEQRARLARDLGVRVASAITPAAGEPDALDGADTIVLAIKPQQMREVTRALAGRLSGQLVISIAAGIRSDDLARWLGNYPRIVRVMPNTPALVLAGVSGLYARTEVSAAERSRAESILQAVGSTLWVDRESLIDAVTAVSGSGPAYVFYFIEAMREAAKELGFDDAAARQLVLGTFTGAVKLAEGASEDVSVLRERVTSKGGTTERALATMRDREVKKHIVQAVHAAMQRGVELGDELGKAD